MEPSWLYAVGLVLVVFFTVMGFDDFVWDILSVVRYTRQKRQNMKLVLGDKTYRMLAIIIAAWHEDNVIFDVIENMIESSIYPRSMYHVFVGVYPNDPKTCERVKCLSETYPNVHIVMNSRPGPTSKAQNVNGVIRYIQQYEQSKGWRFQSFTIHDSEDIVHSYEFLVTNCLIGRYKALQFPVFPLQRMPSWGNFIRTLTACTYSDEFAENHYMTMANRNEAGVFVPSAGTGLALSREIIRSFKTQTIFPEDSLTEDYMLSMQLYLKGYNIHYVLTQVPRLNSKLQIKNEFVATRSMFPKTFQTAVRQKTRWIIGITMQSMRAREMLATGKKFSIAEMYVLFRDRKAKIGNLLSFIGYPVFIYFVLSLFIPLIPIYPKGTLSWYLCWVVTVMMIERQAMRIYSVSVVYGWKSVIFSSLLPPIMPLRIIWGNIISFTATAKAIWKWHTEKVNPAARKGKVSLKTTKLPAKRIRWDKTEHEFLSKNTLVRYHRRMGDNLLIKGLLTPYQLKTILRVLQNEPDGKKLGQYCVEQGFVSEPDVLQCLADTENTMYISTKDCGEYKPFMNPKALNERQLREFKCIPLLEDDQTCYVALCLDSPSDTAVRLAAILGKRVQVCYATGHSITMGIINWQKSRSACYPVLTSAYLNHQITAEQLILAMNDLRRGNQTEKKVLISMGLCFACCSRADEAAANHASSLRSQQLIVCNQTI